MKDNLKLFLTFFKIGLFTFGGGLSMIPLIEKETVERYKWISKEELLDIVIIAESTPGVIAVNSATYIGYKKNKFLGSLFATLGVILPSFIIIILIALVFDNLMENKIVSSAFIGIRAGVAILIINVAYKFFIKLPKKIFPMLLFITSFLLFIFLPQISTIYFIIGGGLLGLIYYLITYKYKDVQV